MRFTTTSNHLCAVCGKLRRGGYHDPCSKKMQAERAAQPKPQHRPPTKREFGIYAEYLRKL